MEASPEESRRKLELTHKAEGSANVAQLRNSPTNEHEVKQLENVCETVDDERSTEEVPSRQNDDWITDNNGKYVFAEGSKCEYTATGTTSATNKRRATSGDDLAAKRFKFMQSNISIKETQFGNEAASSRLMEDIREMPSTSSVMLKNMTVVQVKENQDMQEDSINDKMHSENSKPIMVNVTKSLDNTHIQEASLQIKNTFSQNLGTVEVDAVDTSSRNGNDIEESQVQQFGSQNITIREGSFVENLCEDAPINEALRWENLNTSIENITISNLLIGSHEIPLTDVNGKKVFRFYWWDAFEDSYQQPGVVLLFGKTYSDVAKSYVSCCVAVRDIERKLFVLPRSHVRDNSDRPVTYIDLYTEFKNDIMKPQGISTFRTMYVKKKYAFSRDVPEESDYMVVRYSAKHGKIETSKAGKTFSKIFGVHTSCLEIFLLENKIKGPCWLDVLEPIPCTNPVTWCTFEVNCYKPQNVVLSQTIDPLPVPPLTVATINLRLAINPKTFNSEIIMLACLTQTRYAVDLQAPNPPFTQHFCVFTQLPGEKLPLDIHEKLQNFKGTKVQKMDSEVGLLNYFIAQFSTIDADLIVGHNLQGYQIKMLCERLTKHDIKRFSKLSRIRRANILKKEKFERELFVGRLVCDIKTSVEELIRLVSYDLDSLCHYVLKLQEGQRVDYDSIGVAKMFKASDDILKLISCTMQDTFFILQIMYDLNLIPLALQITNLVGNVMSRTLIGGKSERIEFLLLHVFSENGYIVPDKTYFPKAENKSAIKDTHAGGLVLEPKVGYYDKLTLLMDFNSLYPSIIQEYNICFTTVCHECTEENMEDSAPAVLPTVVRGLVESRKEVKKLLKSPEISDELRMQCDIRQRALKLTANTVYGCLGFSHSRFYFRDLAERVTQKGRQILTNTKDLIERMGYDVLYGDTDSIVINTNSLEFDFVVDIAGKIKQEVDTLYRNVEFHIDSVFRYLLLYAKKQYAAVRMTKTKEGFIKTEKEYKGLDIVKRDWCRLACDTGKTILDHIMSDQSLDDRITNIHNELDRLHENIEQGHIPLQLLIMRKQLSKDPKLYTNKVTLPHVQVALRYNQEFGGHFRSGDIVPYIICEDGSDKPPTQRAFHIDELKRSKTLRIDTKYYLSQQISPVVKRICDPIDVTGSIQTDAHLGLNVLSNRNVSDNLELDHNNMAKAEVESRNVEKFIFVCLNCKQLNSVDGPLKGDLPFIEICDNPQCNSKPVEYLYYIKNQLISVIQSYVERYYNSIFNCDELSCNKESKRISMRLIGQDPICMVCKRGILHREYDEFSLQSQLSYLCEIFDIAALSEKPIMEQQVEQSFHVLRETVKKYLNHSGYAVVDFGALSCYFQYKHVPSLTFEKCRHQLCEDDEEEYL